MRHARFLATVALAGMIGSAVLTGCEKGPAQKTGERIDNAIDKLTGKGPAEKAGERLDKAAKELTKK